jgi:hypothetical protein
MITLVYTNSSWSQEHILCGDKATFMYQHTLTVSMIKHHILENDHPFKFNGGICFHVLKTTCAK